MTAPASVFERIAVVDVLRAFALFGIIVTHAGQGYLAGPPPAPDFMQFSTADQVVNGLEYLLTFGKFFTIFAFLFGLSFAIQLDNARRKGRGFGGRFAWRLVLLLGIGYVHGLFYSGDILAIYAVLGLLLIPVQRIPARWLLVAGLILVFNVPGLLINLDRLNAPPPTPQQKEQMAAQGKQFAERWQRQFQIKSTGTVAQVVKMNASEGLEMKLGFQIRTGRLWVTYGLFLLGLCAGRANLFRDTPENRAFFKRLGIAAGVVAGITTVVAIAEPGQPGSITDVLVRFSFSVQQFSMAALYASIVTLLFWRKPAGLLSNLAPMGKMGLTTYLTQSVFGLLVFFGFSLGLMGKLGVAASVALGIGFYVVQIFIAKWWLRHFAMGPAEWLWRSLTYFRLQPLLRPAVSPA